MTKPWDHLGMTTGGRYTVHLHLGLESLMMLVFVAADRIVPINPMGPYGVDLFDIWARPDRDTHYAVALDQAARDYGMQDATVYWLGVDHYRLEWVEEWANDPEVRAFLEVGEPPVPRGGVIHPVGDGWVGIEVYPRKGLGPIPEADYRRLVEFALRPTFWDDLKEDLQKPRPSGAELCAYAGEVDERIRVRRQVLLNGGTFSYDSEAMKSIWQSYGMEPCGYCSVDRGGKVLGFAAIITPDRIVPLDPMGPYGIAIKGCASVEDQVSLHDIAVGLALEDHALVGAPVYALTVTHYRADRVPDEIRQQLMAGIIPHERTGTIHQVEDGWHVVSVDCLDGSGAVPADHMSRLVDFAVRPEFWTDRSQRNRQPSRLEFDHDQYQAWRQGQRLQENNDQDCAQASEENAGDGLIFDDRDEVPA